MSVRLPRVSVCLLTYNRARILSRTIESLLAQSHEDFELIINDDRSPDDTEAICRAYERRDKRVRYFKNASNLRYAQNQNAAIVRASSPYVAIVHDGDVYRPDLIEKWTEALVAHPSAALVFNALEHMDEAGNVVHVNYHPYGPLVQGRDLFDEMIRQPGSPVFGIVMVRRECVWSVGPFDPRLPVLADVDMWLRLSLRYDVAYVREALLKVSPNEATHQNNFTNWRIAQEHELIYALNVARRYPNDSVKIAQTYREIAPMIWRQRLGSLLACARHLRWRAAWEGVQYCARHPDFSAGAVPDAVLDWEGVARQLGLQGHGRPAEADGKGWTSRFGSAEEGGVS